MLRNKKSGIIGHLFRLKTETLFGCYALSRLISLDEHGGSKASQGKRIRRLWCICLSCLLVDVKGTTR